MDVFDGLPVTGPQRINNGDVCVPIVHLELAVVSERHQHKLQVQELESDEPPQGLAPKKTSGSGEKRTILALRLCTSQTRNCQRCRGRHHQHR